MLGHMKIVARLMVGFGLLVLLIAGLSSYGVYSGKATAQAFGRALRLSNNEMLIQRIEKEIFQGRMLIWVGLATGDGSKAQGAKDAFKLAREDLGTLRADTTAPPSTIPKPRSRRRLPGPSPISSIPSATTCPGISA